jgi:hypothetical protein
MGLDLCCWSRATKLRFPIIFIWKLLSTGLLDWGFVRSRNNFHYADWLFKAYSLLKEFIFWCRSRGQTHLVKKSVLPSALIIRLTSNAI